jgi:hypothetical protein
VKAKERGTLAAMFHEARTFTHWQPRPVPQAIVEAGFELACLGPTPMSGFDADKVDAAFVPDGRYRTNFLLKIGYGDRDSLRPRLPCLRFDEAPRWE